MKRVSQEEWLQRLLLLPAAPHLIFLGACESAVQAAADGLIGMAQVFLQAGAGAVIAMRDKIGVEAAREFISRFYYQLATHGAIDLAANQARSALIDWGGWSWSTPILFLQRGFARRAGKRRGTNPPAPGHGMRASRDQGQARDQRS